MKETVGNIWDYHDKGEWIVITTNGSIRKDGACVMGRGIALQAKQRYPKLPFGLGKLLADEDYGNYNYAFSQYRIITFPVKLKWYQKASLPLIHNSTVGLLRKIMELRLENVYMVRPGCGNGGLDWTDVKPILEEYLDDRFIIVNRD